MVATAQQISTHRALVVEDNEHVCYMLEFILKRAGYDVNAVNNGRDAQAAIENLEPVDVIVLDLMLERGSAFAVADYANYRRPGAKVVYVTRNRFFSDGSLFRHSPNTAAILQEDAPPSDLANIVAYHGRAS